MTFKWFGLTAFSSVSVALCSHTEGRKRLPPLAYRVLGMAEHAYNPSTDDGGRRIRGFKDSLGNTAQLSQ